MATPRSRCRFSMSSCDGSCPVKIGVRNGGQHHDRHTVPAGAERCQRPGRWGRGRSSANTGLLHKSASEQSDCARGKGGTGELLPLHNGQFLDTMGTHDRADPQ